MASKFLICIKNDDYPASLEVRKLYPQIPDADATKHGQVRIIDESGDDYLYPEHYFMVVELPIEVGRRITESA